MRVKSLEVDFPLGLEGSETLPQGRRALKNCFNAGGPIIQRPGITKIGNTGGVGRGLFVWNESLYGVASQVLHKIATDGTTTPIGNVTGGTAIDSAVGFNDAVILDRGGNGYTLDSSDVLTTMVSPQFVASTSVCHINGRFVYIPSDGSVAFFSDVGAADTIQTTSFFDAEELPDKNKVCFNSKNILGIGGSDSFEFFRDIGEQIVPFRRLNARIDNGYIGGLLEYGNTFLFVGREKDQDVGIYSIGQGVAPKISNEYIDTILKTYTVAELENCIPGRIKWNGFDLATFTFSRQAFGFYGGNWFELDMLNDGVNEVWQGGYIKEFDQKYYSLYSDKIGRFDKINKEYGKPFQRLIDMAFINDKRFSVQSLEYRMSQGYNTTTGSVSLQLSHDNVLYSQPFHRDTGAVGEYTKKLEWNYPGGLGAYDGFMGIRISTTEDVDFSALKVFMEMR
ncbi:hypothetical protein MNBD_GAMMA01-1330 [hydrothermal vent metagenome]|uniref:Uncharacterized protein n=1 Tax=hydrothermal vent metagenome TaxID=652676 RepID=A0A3B0VIV4_9ZZZZ